MNEQTLIELRIEMRQAAKKRELSAWARRAKVDRSWCEKFLRGEIKSPGFSQIRKMLDSRDSEHAA